MGHTFGMTFKNSSPSLRSRDFLLYSKSFIDLHLLLNLWSIELSCLQDMRLSSRILFFSTNIQLLQQVLLFFFPQLEKAILSPLKCFCTFLKNQLNIPVELFLGSVRCCTGFCVSPPVTPSWLLQLYEVLKLGWVIPPTFIIIFHSCFGYSTSSAFVYKFQIFL